jgi:hypothetical protein
MKLTPVPACIAVLLLMSGCARMKVSYEIEPAYDFGKIRTYQWIEPSREILEQDDTYLSKALQQALNNELSVRGWEQVLEAGGATVQVTYYIKIKEHQEYVESSSRSESEFAGGLVFKTGEWSYEERVPDQQVYTVETGVLHMMVTDTASDQRVWQGSLKTKLDRSAPIEKQQELFQLAAHKLLEQLPSGSK